MYPRRNKPPEDLLADYAALEYILLGDLRDLLEAAVDEETCHWLLAVLDELLETLPREFELKQRDGYLSEVLEEYPSWYRHVESLRAEHERLYDRLRQLRDRLARQRPLAPVANLLRAELRDWMHSLTAYHRHENRLLQTAMNLEVGVGD